VNQVFEILVKWVETRNWEEALYSVIPKRKFIDGGNTQKDDDEEEVLYDEEVDEDQVNKLERPGSNADTTEDAGCEG
jgi:tRNA (guanine9-N1)-methyltransferase